MTVAASDIAYNTFKKIHKDLPFNNTKMYAEVFLENSRCKVYIPIRQNLCSSAGLAKAFWEQLANTAEL
jgi:hypothetical protein